MNVGGNWRNARVHIVPVSEPLIVPRLVVIRTVAELLNRFVVVSFPGGRLRYRVIRFSGDTLSFVSDGGKQSTLPWVTFQEWLADGTITLEDVTSNREAA